MSHRWSLRMDSQMVPLHHSHIIPLHASQMVPLHQSQLVPLHESQVVTPHDSKILPLQGQVAQVCSSLLGCQIRTQQALLSTPKTKGRKPLYSSQETISSGTSAAQS